MLDGDGVNVGYSVFLDVFVLHTVPCRVITITTAISSKTMSGRETTSTGIGQTNLTLGTGGQNVWEVGPPSLPGTRWAPCIGTYGMNRQRRVKVSKTPHYLVNNIVIDEEYTKNKISEMHVNKKKKEKDVDGRHCT